MFVGLGEGAIGGQHLALGHAHDGGGVRTMQGAAKDPSADRLSSSLRTWISFQDCCLSSSVMEGPLSPSTGPEP